MEATKYEIDANSKARRAQGGKGLLSQSISIQSLKNPWLKPQSLERRREEEGRGDRREGGVRLGSQKREREERGRGGIYGAHAGV